MASCPSPNMCKITARISLIWQYYSARASLSPDVGAAEGIAAKLELIWPATEADVRKYSFQRSVNIKETPEIYNKVVLPFIDSIDPSRIEWYVPGRWTYNMHTGSTTYCTRWDQGGRPHSIQRS